MGRVNHLWTVAWRYQEDECRVSSEDLECLFMPRLLGNHVATQIPWQPWCQKTLTTTGWLLTQGTREGDGKLVWCVAIVVGY